MREKGERVRVLADRRKGGWRILIETESVYKAAARYDVICSEKVIKEGD